MLLDKTAVIKRTTMITVASVISNNIIITDDVITSGLTCGMNKPVIIKWFGD